MTTSAMFYSDDVKAEFEHIQARGAEVVMAPTDVPGSIIARVRDGCGNLIQISQLRWQG
jgi:predicted enzyme related to lactoylglutathione lyase